MYIKIKLQETLWVSINRYILRFTVRYTESELLCTHDKNKTAITGRTIMPKKANIKTSLKINMTH